MPIIDSNTLFTALGFLAVVMQGKEGQKDCAQRALTLAALIREFCQSTLPQPLETAVQAEANTDADADAQGGMLDQLIQRYKDNLSQGKPSGLSPSPHLLLKIYHRLQRRQRPGLFNAQYWICVATACNDLNDKSRKRIPKAKKF